jgi:hypothetical protein
MPHIRSTACARHPPFQKRSHKSWPPNITACRSRRIGSTASAIRISGYERWMAANMF